MLGTEKEPFSSTTILSTLTLFPKASVSVIVSNAPELTPVVRPETWAVLFVLSITKLVVNVELTDKSWVLTSGVLLLIELGEKTSVVN